MPAISPAGFQNHIQNPLSGLLWAILDARLQDRADERQFNRETRDEARSDHDRRLNLALAGAHAGQAIDVPDAVPEERGLLEAIINQQTQQQRQQAADQVDKRRQTALENQWRQRRDWRDEAAAQREDARLGLDRAKTTSGIADTWADNLGAVLDGVGKRVFPSRADGGATKPMDATKALREAAARWEISHGTTLPLDTTGNIDWTSDAAQQALPQVQRLAAGMAGIDMSSSGDATPTDAIADPATAVTPPPTQPVSARSPFSIGRFTMEQPGLWPDQVAEIADAGKRPVEPEFVQRHLQQITASAPGSDRQEYLRRLKAGNPALYAAVIAQLTAPSR